MFPLRFPTVCAKSKTFVQKLFVPTKFVQNFITRYICDNYIL